MFAHAIKQMKERKETLTKYNEEVKVTNIKVEKVDEVLKYILRICNYPMEPVTNINNVAWYICQIFDNGKDDIDIENISTKDKSKGLFEN